MKMRPMTLITSTCAPFRAGKSPAPRPGVPGGIIDRTQQARLAVDEDQRLALVPRMVARGDDIGAGVDELLADRLGDAEAARRILAIDDDEIGGIARSELRQFGDHGLPARPSHHIAQKQNAHPIALALHRAGVFARA